MYITDNSSSWKPPFRTHGDDERSSICKLMRLWPSRLIAFWVIIVLAYCLTACTPAVISTSQTTPAPVATFTPTPFVVDGGNAANASVAQIDAAGLDFAERRIIDVYERVSPSVVSITTETLRRGFFFEVIPQEGSGSGFILDADGHILTNYHVIKGAQRIEVNFGDDTVLEARAVGVDPRNDVAVLRVDALPTGVYPVDLGTSTGLHVGQRAIAIGNPFGQFGRTLTTGVISALDRTLEGPDERTITGIIQTDAAINRGNSGGPLLDSSGRVIGVNTAIFSPSGASAGVGFAVPIDTVKRLLPDLLALGRYRHPWLGIRYAYAIRPGFAEQLNLPVSEGLLLVQLYRGSPLMQADVVGAQREIIVGNQRVYVGGDIVVAVDGHSMATIDALETYLEDNYRVGDTVTLTLMRDGNQFDLPIVLGEEPN